MLKIVYIDVSFTIISREQLETVHSIEVSLGT